MLKIHKYMDSTYQSKIDTWGLSQYGWSDDLGFAYDLIGESGVSENLENMIGKLEGYKQDLDLRVYEIFNGKSSSDVKIYNSNKNVNTITNTVNFNAIIQNIKDNESLTEEQTKEALSYLRELQVIFESKESRKIKWEKAKRIIAWLLDKGVDVAISYLPVIVSMISK